MPKKPVAKKRNKTSKLKAKLKKKFTKARQRQSQQKGREFS